MGRRSKSQHRAGAGQGSQSRKEGGQRRPFRSRREKAEGAPGPGEAAGVAVPSPRRRPAGPSAPRLFARCAGAPGHTPAGLTCGAGLRARADRAVPAQEDVGRVPDAPPAARRAPQPAAALEAHGPRLLLVDGLVVEPQDLLQAQRVRRAPGRTGGRPRVRRPLAARGAGRLSHPAGGRLA